MERRKVAFVMIVVLVLSISSVSAYTLGIKGLQNIISGIAGSPITPTPTPQIIINQVYDCNANECHKDGYENQDFGSLRMAKKQKPNNDYINCTKSTDGCTSLEQTNGGYGCYCYEIASRGECDNNLQCQGMAEINATSPGRPCKCGTAKATDQEPFCFEEANKVFTNQNDCLKSLQCYDNCDSSIGSCEGEICDRSWPSGNGVCDAQKKCETKPTEGDTFCRQLGGTCQNLKVIFNDGYSSIIIDECKKACQDSETESADDILLCEGECERLSSAQGFNLQKYTELQNRYFCYKSNLNANGEIYRIPGKDEIDRLDFTNAAIKNSILGDLEGGNNNIFWNEYISDPNFRGGLCGDLAQYESRDPKFKWDVGCCIHDLTASSACFDISLLDDGLFGPPVQDPLSQYLWYKQAWSEEYKIDLGDWEIGGAFGELAGGYTEMFCSSYGRKHEPADLTADFPPRTDIEGLVLSIKGQNISGLPDGTSLYEITWMLLNTRGSGKNINYSVYAYDDQTVVVDGNSVHPVGYVKNEDGVKVKNLELKEGESTHGYYAFYYDKNPETNESVTFEKPCIKHTITPKTPYCPQPFISEDYEGENDIEEPSEESGGGGEDSIPDDTVELDV